MKLLRTAASLATLAVAAAAGCQAFAAKDDATEPPKPPLSDASAGDDAASPRFCASADAAFCADFEEPPANRDWTRVTAVRGTASLVPITMAIPSSSNALSNALEIRIADQRGLFDAAADAEPPNGFAVLGKDLVRNGNSRVAVDVDIRAVNIAGKSAYVAVLSLVFQRAPTRYLSIVVNPTESALFVYNPDLTVVPAPRLPSGWFHCRLEADIAAGTARLLYDGSVVASSAAIVSAEPGVTVDLGVYQNPAFEETHIEYDNLVTTFSE